MNSQTQGVAHPDSGRRLCKRVSIFMPTEIINPTDMKEEPILNTLYPWLSWQFSVVSYRTDLLELTHEIAYKPVIW